MNDFNWSKAEKKIAKDAFGKAYQRESEKIIEEIKNYKLEKPEDIWSLSEMLNKREKEIEQIYDYRYSQLIMVFAILIKRGFLSIKDLAGLSDDKLDHIKKLMSERGHR
jgi:hypothetical protein